MTHIKITCASYAALAAVTALAACNRNIGDAHAENTSMSYDITTETRPVSLDGYLKGVKAIYLLCAEERKMLQLPPPPPFVVVPQNFVVDRTNYVSDGKVFLRNQEQFWVNTSETTVEQGCKTRLTSTMSSSVIRDGVEETAERDDDGKITFHSTVPQLPKDADTSGGFSLRKGFNGIATRCAPPGLHELLGRDLCIFDTPLGVPLQGNGGAITAHLRMMLTDVINSELVIEPIKAEVGKPIDKARLVLPGGR